MTTQAALTAFGGGVAGELTPAPDRSPTRASEPPQLRLVTFDRILRGDLLEPTPDSATEHRLVACPICLRPFPCVGGYRPSEHIATHEPDEIGLEPLRSETVAEGERPRLVADGGQPREARISTCQCGICETVFQNGSVVEIAKKLARHWNEEHGDELRYSMEPFETVEYGGEHLHDNEYAIKRLDRYVTAYDVIDPGDGSPFKYQYAKAIESEDTCEDCWRPIDEVEEYRELDDGGWRDTFLCRPCHERRKTERRREENEDLQQFATDGGFRRSTDRYDGTIVAECPNECAGVIVEYEDAAADSEVIAEVKKVIEECPTCGAEIDFIQQETPSEVLE